MAVSSADSEVRYAGTGSTGPFEVTFKYLDLSHIYVSLIPEAGADAELLTASDYTITVSGGVASVTTTAAVAVGETLVIFRDVPLTQPTVFARTGSFPAASAERALDRLEMQIQQINRRVEALTDGATPVGADLSSAANVTWADDAARATTKATRAGQLGVQKDTQTVWISQSTTAGDWEEFRPRRGNVVILGYTADAGLGSEERQGKIVGMFDAWGVDGVLFAGGGNFSGPDLIEVTYANGQNGTGTSTETVSGYDYDWAWFHQWIDAGTAFPALGAPDVDYDGWEDRLAAKFPYIADQNGGRYYKTSFGEGLVDVFVLHSGVNSAGDVVETDGNEVDSTQHQWFVAQLAASTARWKIAVFHAPPATLCTTAGVTLSEMAWPELAQCHLILCGGAHLSEILRWKETMLANFSALVYDDGAIGELTGETSYTDRRIWADDTHFACGRIIATDERLEIECWEPDAGAAVTGPLLHCSNTQVFPAYEVSAPIILADASDGNTYKLISTDGVLGLELVS